ncbi:MAG: C10 family peptidase, partial [Deltaproteobacteria bacterium]|nr:C10 family peptidase [Deltaproteobacteria bacterium]
MRCTGDFRLGTRIYLAGFSIVFLIFFILDASCLSAPVSRQRALLVAEEFLADHHKQYGSWGEAPAGRIYLCEEITCQDLLVAYNFRTSPRGHILVPRWDEFSPVLLYSTTSEFDPERVSDPRSIESWIIPELYAAYRDMQGKRQEIDKTIDYRRTRVARAWGRLDKVTEYISDEETNGEKADTLIQVGPLLSTAWDQDYPYNIFCPIDANGCQCITGCVATAQSQVLKYWNWPDRGEGSHSYLWDSNYDGQPDTELSADFSARTYDWEQMPDHLTVDSSDIEKEAVARLIADVGIAADMDYGCSSSGSYAYGDEVFDEYFRYQEITAATNRHYRDDYDAASFFNLYRTEFDAVPPRVVVLSIWVARPGRGGHEVVADGYQIGDTNRIHINLGWSGSYDGFYDVTYNFTTGSYTWDASTQVIVTNIMPDAAVIQAEAGTGGSIEPAGMVSLAEGTDQTFTIAANEGYEVSDVIVDGGSLGPVTSYTFESVTGTHTVYAFFALQTFMIEASAGSGGSISPEGHVIVTTGSDQSFSITPETGYHIDDVVVDGASVGPVTSHTFVNVTEDHTIEATFAVNVYTITASAGAGGGISPSGIVPVEHGSDRVFTMTPDEGFHISDVLVDGISAGTGTTYTFASVSANHTIHVDFDNLAPVADAGDDETVPEGTQVTLDGSGSYDPDGTIVSSFWECVEASQGSEILLADEHSLQPSFTAPAVGPDGELLTFRLTVTDDGGATDRDECVITVSWVNEPPVADAGA